MADRIRAFLNRPVQVTMRSVLLLTVAMVIVMMTTAFNLKAQQVATRQRCEENAKRAAATAPALAKVVAASRADGDRHMTAFWQSYLDVIKRNPVPKC